MNPERPRFEKPSLRSALVLAAAWAFSAGAFYLIIGRLGESIFYGALVGCGLAAAGAEIITIFRSHRAAHDTRNTTAVVAAIAWQSFRSGFVVTFTALAKDLFMLIGVKLFISLVIAASAWYALSGHSP